MSNATAIRIAMAAEGWHSEDRIATHGWESGFGYSIWFKRWGDWHGTRYGWPACYHAHTPDLSAIDKATAEAAAIARDAWNRFPEFPPDQLADGTLREDAYLRRVLTSDANPELEDLGLR